MFWILIGILFMQDGTMQPGIKVEPTEQACVADKEGIKTGPAPQGAMAALVACQGPYSNPTTARKS